MAANPIDQREIIAAELAHFIGADYVDDCLAIWDEKFSATPKASVQAYVFELSNFVELGRHRSALVMNLVKALHASGVTSGNSIALRPPVPVTASEPTPEAARMASSFELLAEQYLAAAPSNQAPSLRAAMIAEIESESLPLRLKTSMLAWLRQEAPLRMPVLPERGLRLLMSGLRSTAAETLGASAAEEMLFEAKRAVKRVSGGMLPAEMSRLL